MRHPHCLSSGSLHHSSLLKGLYPDSLLMHETESAGRWEVMKIRSPTIIIIIIIIIIDLPCGPDSKYRNYRS